MNKCKSPSKQGERGTSGKSLRRLCGRVLLLDVRVAYTRVVEGSWVLGEVSDLDALVVGPREAED